MKIYKQFLWVHIFFGQWCYGQQHNEDSLFNKFRNDIQDEQAFNHGHVVIDDQTRETYYLLMSSLPLKALVKYTDDSIPAVRSQIFVGLVLKNTEEIVLKEILNKHINDTAKFTFKGADLNIEHTVIGYMKWILDYKSKNSLEAIDYKVKLEELRNKNNFRETYVIIPGVHHGIVPKDSLLKLDSLVCTLEGHRIISFSLTTAESTTQTSHLFTERIKGVIRKLRTGEKIYLDEIVVEMPDKSMRRLGSIPLMIR